MRLDQWTPNCAAASARTGAAFWSALRGDTSHTILAASHRRAALKRADWIIVLRDGDVVDQGSFHELVERCDEMRELWSEERDPE
jgi:ATP-binding cassette, subfamily B, bacterial